MGYAHATPDRIDRCGSYCLRWREPGAKPNGIRRNRVSGNRGSTPGTGPASGFPCDRQCAHRGNGPGAEDQWHHRRSSRRLAHCHARWIAATGCSSHIKTDDGEIILVTYSGAFAASKEVNDRFNNGEVLTSKDAYFITAPQFTTGSKKYDWLNQIQAVGKMVSIQRGVKIKYDWFIVR
jgi:hypothetical protein